MTTDDRTGPLAVIVLVGGIAALALVGALALALLDKPEVTVDRFLGLCLATVGLLLPSPLSKMRPATPAEPVGEDVTPPG